VSTRDKTARIQRASPIEISEFRDLFLLGNHQAKPGILPVAVVEQLVRLPPPPAPPRRRVEEYWICNSLIQAGVFEYYQSPCVRPAASICLGGSAPAGSNRPYADNTIINSNHPGGLNVVLVDGSVRFISDTIEYETLTRLAVRYDGLPVSAP